MTWRDQPALKGKLIGKGEPSAKSQDYGPTGGGTDEARRSAYYANPPSNPGLSGLQLETSPDRRRGFVRNGVVSVATFMSRKRMPYR